MRVDGRRADQLRPVYIEPDFLDYADGSALITCGKTRVLCAATIADSVPVWLAGKGRGWITAEYAMLPRSTQQRTSRETKGLSGRTQEIRRIIGRSLRASLDLAELGERMITIDCDVLQADGGTRTASITGGQVALTLAIKRLEKQGLLPAATPQCPVAAVSLGIVGEKTLLDLCYAEDSTADVDLNVVMNCRGEYIEVQGTAEGCPFDRPRLDEMLDLAKVGITSLFDMQQAAIHQAVAANPEVYCDSYA